jgi:hypothetical protein
MTDFEAKAEVLARIAAGKAVYDELPSDNELEETAVILARIDSGKLAYDELPSNEELEETADLADRIVAGQEAYNGRINVLFGVLIAQLAYIGTEFVGRVIGRCSLDPGCRRSSRV